MINTAIFICRKDVGTLEHIIPDCKKYEENRKMILNYIDNNTYIIKPFNLNTIICNKN